MQVVQIKEAKLDVVTGLGLAGITSGLHSKERRLH